MNTNVGMNWQAVMWLVMSAVTAMDSGTERTVLLSIGMTVMAILAFATRGSGLSEKAGKEVLDVSKDLKDILEDDRAN